MAYTKLDDNILTSSLWSRDDKTLRVWIYLLARAGADGCVRDTVPAIARSCGYQLGEVKAILDELSEPDPYSRTPEREGRRVEIRLEPEFVIWLVNHARYRAKDHTNADRQRRHRNGTVTARNAGVTVRNAASRCVTQAEAEAEATTETDLSASADALAGIDKDLDKDDTKVQASLIPSAVDQVYAYWSKASDTSPRSSGVIRAIKARIRKRLDEGSTPQQLMDCVSWAMVDEFYTRNGYAKQPVVVWKDAERVGKLAGCWAARATLGAAPASAAPAAAPPRPTTLADIAAEQRARQGAA